MRILKVLLLALATLAGLSAPALAQVRVTIEGEQFQPRRIALPVFDGSSPQAQATARQISDVIRSDLASSVVFELVDPNAFIERDLDINLAPRFPDWRTINAEYLLVGNIEIDAANNSRMVTQFRLYDVFSGNEMYAQQLTVATPDNWRRVAHKVADAVYEQLTGEKGYFDSRVVFVSESGPKLERRRQLAIMDQDGANAEHLLSGVSTVQTAHFSPNSQTIIYSAHVPDARNPAITRLRVFLYDIDTGRQEVLGEADNAMDFAARFSPDGRHVIMSRSVQGNSEIFEIELARREMRQLTNSPAIDTAPSYSPDGEMIVFTSDRGESAQIYTMRRDQREFDCPTTGRRETACRISWGQGTYQTPVWSPRGDWIAFTKSQGGKFLIGVMTADGTPGPDGQVERILVESDFAEGPTWSPNGRVIAFTRKLGRSSPPELWTVDLTGRNLRPLQTPRDASDPAWSPLLR